MKSIHLIITDLFLPNDLSAEVCADLRLPALEKMLARGASTGSARTGADSARTDVAGLAPSTGSGPSTSSGRAGDVGASLENHLCELFGVPCAPDAPIAPISAAYDGLGEGCWLRADPVHLRLQRDQLVLLPNVKVSGGEAEQLCAALNGHFAGQGMEFFAPHPQRWYVRIDRLPRIETVSLSLAAGRNVRGLLPSGTEAAHWHRVFNEVQMLLFAHPLNEAREARGELTINSVWFWGGGCSPDALLRRVFDSVSSDDGLAGMLAAVAGIPATGWQGRWTAGEGSGRQLLVWTGLRSALQQGDLNAWRAALQDFETAYAQPLWQALRAGKVSQLQIDVLGGGGVRSLRLNRGDTWAFWRSAKPLAAYSIV